MTLGLSAVCYVIALILFALAATPPLGAYPLLPVGLAFFVAGHLAP